MNRNIGRGNGVLGLRVGTSTQGERSRHMAFVWKGQTNNGTGHEHDIACKGQSGNPVMGNGGMETHRRLCISQDALRLFPMVISVLNV